MFKEFFYLVFVSNKISKLSKEYMVKYKTLRTSFHSDCLSYRHFLFLYFLGNGEGKKGCNVESESRKGVMFTELLNSKILKSIYISN